MSVLSPLGTFGALRNETSAANRGSSGCFMSSFYAPSSSVIASFVYRVQDGGNDTDYRLGIYKGGTDEDEISGAKLLWDSGLQSADDLPTAGTMYWWEISLDIELEVGELYWLVFQTGAVAPTQSVASPDHGDLNLGIFFWSSANNYLNNGLPDPAPAKDGNTNLSQSLKAYIKLAVRETEDKPIMVPGVRKDLSGNKKANVAVYPFAKMSGQSVFRNSGTDRADIGAFRVTFALSTATWYGYHTPTGLSEYPVGTTIDDAAWGAATSRWFINDIHSSNHETLVLHKALVQGGPIGTYDIIDGQKGIAVYFNAANSWSLFEWTGTSTWSTLTGQSAQTLNFSDGDWVWVRFRRAGTSYYAKAWHYGSSEPSEWQNSGTSTYVNATTSPAILWRAGSTIIEATNYAWFSGADGGFCAPSTYQDELVPIPVKSDKRRVVTF